MDGKHSHKELLKQNIKAGAISREDGEHALAFLEHYGTLTNLSEGSLAKYYFAFKGFLEALQRQGKTVHSLTEPDVVSLIKFLQSTDWSEDTREDYWKRWCKFYEWLVDRSGESSFNPAVLRLMVGKKKYRYKVNKNKVQKKGILTPEEVLRLVHLETDPAYKVYFAVLYESGMRAGESFSLLLRDVEKHPDRGYVLHLRSSKTEKRQIPLLHFSASYLNKWLQTHPRKNDPDAPLFVNTLGEQLENATANKRLRKLLKAAGIDKKKMSLHSFRHSRATELCHMMTEAQLCKYFGWAIGSTMPQTYIRAEAIDIRGALNKGYGFEKQTESHEIKGRTCLHCSNLNPFDAEYCDFCTMPLDAKRLEQVKTTVEAVKMETLVEKLLEEKYGPVIQRVIKQLEVKSQ